MDDLSLCAVPAGAKTLLSLIKADRDRALSKTDSVMQPAVDMEPAGKSAEEGSHAPHHTHTCCSSDTLSGKRATTGVCMASVGQ